MVTLLLIENFGCSLRKYYEIREGKAFVDAHNEMIESYKYILAQRKGRRANKENKLT
jgi:hypothetical protein